MKKIIPIVYFLLQLQAFSALATHVVGGELNYRHLGGNNYEIRLTVYRDCINGQPPFDDPASIGIFDASGMLVNLPYNFSGIWNFTLYTNAPFNNNLQGYLIHPNDSQDVPASIIDPCLVPPTNICYRVCHYIDTINLPPIPGGYQLVYQRCCRNGTILNIVGPLNVGGTYNAFIPDPAITTINSNPVFNNWPPTFICADEPFVFDHSATDFDGDSLVYVLCDPLDGASTGLPMPQPPFAPPYTPVTWQPPYGPGNVFGGVPLTINPQTGWVAATPNTVGQFVYGVCVEEYRNGNFLGATRRDYQINVVTCPPIVVASILSPTLACGALAASFTNNSFGAAGYHWDFGVSTLLNDTSNLSAPSYVYPDTGTYTSMLIAYSAINPACTDTSWGTVIVYPPLIAGFSYQGVPCTTTVMFTDSSSSGSGTLSSWQWDFGDNTTSNLQNPGHTYASPGTYVVTLIVATIAGCRDTISMNVDVVNVQPVATFNYNNIICTGDCIFNNLSQWSTNFSWDFGDNSFSTAANPSHTYGQSGSYTVIMIASDSTGCADTTSQVVTITSPPSASFTSNIPPCSLTGAFTNTSSPGVVSYQWDFGDSTSSTAQSPSHTYMQSGTYSVTLIVTDNNGCVDTVTYEVSPFVFSLADFSYVVDTCAMQVIFTNSSINAESVLWSFGDGANSQSFVPIHSYLQNGNYPVNLITNPGTSCADTMETILNYDLATVGNIWAPNAFTPNSDGKNDVFKVFSYYPCDDLTFYVFNRWGEKIYEYTGPEIVWDGFYDGKPVEGGIYIYILKGIYTDKVGSIAVIR